MLNRRGAIGGFDLLAYRRPEASRSKRNVVEIAGSKKDTNVLFDKNA